ncbi:MAG TPA: PQQ-binding-like beta-propeller repeat protein [Bacteroidales bacterium]|nr:PQQ-binding-like beta-propeller repeat protein [Bacteroidales bacterium]
MKTLVSICILLSFIILPAKEKISEWRGPERTGIYRETGLLKSWPAEGPAEMWTASGLGNGFGSPVFTESNFYITGEIDTISILFCFNLKGEKQWSIPLGREWSKSYPGSRSAPTIAGNLIYAGTGMGDLFCVNTSGKLVWSKKLSADFDGILPLHGHSESALIDGDKVFWNAGGKKHNVVALNRFTGKLIWSSEGFKESSAYNPPKLIRHPAGNILVTFSSYHMMGFDAETGKLLWSHEQTNYPPEKRGPGYGDTHANTVIYDNGILYYTEGDGNGSVALKISPDRSSITEIWRNPKFDSFMGGVVKIGNFMYGCGTVRPLLYSINTVNGELTDSVKIGTGAVISADNMLYYYTQKGEMHLLSYADGKMKDVSSFKVKKGNLQHFSHPVINKGILYQRHGNTLIAYDIKKKN